MAQINILVSFCYSTGMQVLEWNGIPLTGKTYEEVQCIMGQPCAEAELCLRLWVTSVFIYLLVSLKLFKCLVAICQLNPLAVLSPPSFSSYLFFLYVISFDLNSPHSKWPEHAVWPWATTSPGVPRPAKDRYLERLDDEYACMWGSVWMNFLYTHIRWPAFPRGGP